MNREEIERSALLDRIASLEAAIWNAIDAFRSMGCSADADELEEAMDQHGASAVSPRTPLQR